MTSEKGIPTEEEVLGYIESQSNWGRWGKDDQLGTLNLITEEKRKQAGTLIRDGVSVSCSWLITREMPGDRVSKVIHYMSRSGEKYSTPTDGDENEEQQADEFIGMVFHGLTITHLDSISHTFWKGQMYNGRPSQMVTTAQGATANSVEVVSHGVVTRGVLLDIPRLRGVKWLEGTDTILPQELEETEKAEGVKVESGDVLFIRTGHLARHFQAGPLEEIWKSHPGANAACIPWFRERDIAILGSDCDQDSIPSGYEAVRSPIHQIGIPHLGLWLIDNANLEDLAKACADRNRWEFMLAIAPLRFQYATGSPVNPIAVF